MNNTILEYLKSPAVGLEEPIALAVAEMFRKHCEIENEFSYWILNGKTPDGPIEICACGKTFTADTLTKNYKGIKSYYDAYSMLALLKDKPDYAVSLLSRGLPIK